MPLTNFPASLDSWTGKTDNTDDVLAAHVNKLQDAVDAVETKLGIDSSAVVTSIEYILKNASSSNPGHKHTLAAGATDVTATAAEINTACDGSTAKNSHTHTLSTGGTDVTATAAEINTACDGSTAKNSHTHDDRYYTEGEVDSLIAAVELDDNSVSQAKLKKSSGSVNVNNSRANCTLPGGAYGFYPQVKNTAIYPDYYGYDAYIAVGAENTSYVTNIYLDIASHIDSYVYAHQTYITSSGEVFWIYLLRDRTTGMILQAWQAPDHPCFGNGGKPALVRHPFQTFALADKELIVINPNPDEVLNLREKAITDDVVVQFDELKGFNPTDMVEFHQGDGRLLTMSQKEVISLEKEKGIHSDVRFTVVRPDRDILQVVADEFDFLDHNVWPEKEVTVGLPRRVKVGKTEIPLEEVPFGTRITPYKRQIPYMEGISVKKLQYKG